MIRAVLVDDERLALMNLKMMLEALGNVAIVATFTDSRKAVSEAAYLNPDVIFLDIDMPELNGLQAAEIIQIHCPGQALSLLPLITAMQWMPSSFMPLTMF